MDGISQKMVLVAGYEFTNDSGCLVTLFIIVDANRAEPGICTNNDDPKIAVIIFCSHVHTRYLPCDCIRSRIQALEVPYFTCTVV